jgi:hypothetical protein
MMSRIDSQHWKISTGRHFQNGHHNTAKNQHCPISSKFDMWVDNDVPTLKNFYRSPFSKWPPQYRTHSTLSDFNDISYVGRLWCPEMIPDIKKCLPVAIFKMVATIPHKFNIVRFQRPELIPDIEKTLSHKVVSSTPALAGFELTPLVVIGTDCISSCKSNYHTITANLYLILLQLRLFSFVISANYVIII